MTDVRADERLDVIRPLPADIPPIVYGASVTRLASRPNLKASSASSAHQR
jgi:hypothetical protein